MTSLPFPKPTTREMARKNAVHYAEEAASSMQPGGTVSKIQVYLEAANAWAAIAATFPFDGEDALMADDRPILDPVYLGGGTEPVDNAEGFDPRPMAERNGFTDPDTTAVMQPSVAHVEATDRTAATITVDAIAWDVLRAVAIRHVVSSMERGVTIDLDEERHSVWALQFSRMPDSAMVHVSVNRPPA
jgi:hypothetical protein